MATLQKRVAQTSTALGGRRALSCSGKEAACLTHYEFLIVPKLDSGLGRGFAVGVVRVAGVGGGADAVGSQRPWRRGSFVCAELQPVQSGRDVPGLRHE
jgi:hypothetical protein